MFSLFKHTPKASERDQSLLSSQMQKGQALLIVVLVLAVSLVVVLSVASRTTTDISKSTYDENALRAFSAAEAGVEDALLRNVGTGESAPVVVDSSANVSYTSVITAPSVSDSFNHPEPILSGQTRTFWLVSHASDGSLTCNGQPCTRANSMEVCWGVPGTDGGSAQTPAVEVTLYYDETKQAVAGTNNYANVKTYRFTADPSSSRRNSNNFSSASSTCSFGSYAFSSENTINLATLPGSCSISSTGGIDGGCMLMAKVRSLYNTNTPHPVGLRISPVGGATLPAQGTQVDSTGTAGDSTRKVSVFRSFSEPQSIFDAGVFSFNDLTK